MSTLKEKILNEIKSLLQEETFAQQGYAAPVAGGTAMGATGAVVGGALAGAAAGTAGAVGVGAAAVGIPIALATGALFTGAKAFLSDDPKYLRLIQQAKDTKSAARVFASIIDDVTGANASAQAGYAMAVLLQTIDPKQGVGDWKAEKKVFGKDIPAAGQNTGSNEKSFEFVYEYYKITNPSAAEAIRKLGKVPDGLNYPSGAIAKFDAFWRTIIRMQADRIWKGAKSVQSTSPMPKPPEPKPELPTFKYPGCSKPQFVGKNGKTKGAEVESVQRALEVYTMERSAKGKFTYNGISDVRGTFGPATEQAVYDFQKEQGGKFASRITSQLGSSLGNPDACVGPKTGCALVIIAGGEVAGYDSAKCKARFGAKKIKRGVLAKTETPEENPIAESKNWVDRTREETTSNLFERLVKDSAKKVI